MDRVEVLESDDPGIAGDGHVYNLEVEELHTYIANGVVVHNCHHILESNKWGRAAALFPNARMLGVTATPQRADGKGLGRGEGGVFDALVQGPPMRWLIREGYLTDYRIFGPPSDLDLSQVRTGSTGDYSKPQLAKAVHRSHIVGDVVSSYLRIAPGKLGVTFAVDVEHAREIAEKFRAAGVPAASVHAHTPDETRVRILRQFRRREILQLVNVDLFGEGFDLPAIEVVSMARPTQSFVLYSQQFGRALRPMPGKTHAIVIDHVGNVVPRHSLPDAPREWSLARREGTSRSGSGVATVRCCLQCTAVYERFHTACPFCGHAPVPAQRSAPEHVDGDLSELDPATLAALRGDVEAMDRPLREYEDSLRRRRMPEIGVMAAGKRHHANQMEQGRLRESMAVWAGLRKAEGLTDREQWRRFWADFGVDVLTAQTLKASEAEKLRNVVDQAVSRDRVRYA